MARFRLWWLLFLAVPAAFALHWLGVGGPGVEFVVAGLGIVPLAALLGEATDGLASRLGPAWGGLLNATFGNAAELIIGLAALRHGQFRVVKASLVGSVIGNALLVLGLSLFVGGLRYPKLSFSRTQASLQSTLLVVVAIGLVIPSLLFHTLGPQGATNLSVEVAAVLLATYLLSLVFSLLSHREKDCAIVSAGAGGEGDGRGLGWSVALLAGTTALIALLSEYLVGAIAAAGKIGLLDRLGMSEVFVGVILVAVVGNAAEHATAVQMAYRNRVELTLHIAVGSSLQIALLVTPLLVFASLALAPRPLDLHFSMLEVLALAASVAVVGRVAADGESHWMEGVLLMAVYLILALAFYHLPAGV